jgi:hypothetical protein
VNNAQLRFLTFFETKHANQSKEVLMCPEREYFRDKPGSRRSILLDRCQFWSLTDQNSGPKSDATDREKLKILTLTLLRWLRRRFLTSLAPPAVSNFGLAAPAVSNFELLLKTVSNSKKVEESWTGCYRVICAPPKRLGDDTLFIKS